jgi:hypothetical protein
MALIQPLLAPTDMIRTIVSRAVLAIVAAARRVSIGVVSVGDVSVGGVQVAVVRRRRRRRAVLFRRRRGRGPQARVKGLHVEGEVVGLRAGESGGAVDGEEFFEEAVALAALDVAAAAAGVGVGVQRHLRGRSFGLVVLVVRRRWSWVDWLVWDWINAGFITGGLGVYGAMENDCCSEAAPIGYLDKACEVLLCRLCH